MLYLGYLIVLYSIFIQLLYHRKLPVWVMRLWFSINVVLQVIISCVVCQIITFLSKILNLYSLRNLHRLSIRACSIIFKYVLPFQFSHIHIEYMSGSLRWSDIKNQHCMCITHASFFDVILFLFLAPTNYITNARTFNKASLWKLPLFGYVIKACGHFPVYFTEENSSSFKVDKEKQVEVAARVEEFLNEDGSLAFFPEGALNRTPEVLKELRLGSFNTIIAHKLPIYYIITYGNHEVWPPDLKGAPGYPADIYVYLGKFEYDADAVDARFLSTALRDDMQKHLDDMIALRKKRNYEPWNRVSS
ncbi:unnamed protein product [Phytomonas sp. Hart1]|nr:unnamed protein product [Phytomonas sp. Hart1]|eukprot:CCW67297.1 unnamed protein product [Phytomonas sp. isolate Hart1]